MDAWLGFAAELHGILDEAEIASVRKDIMKRARAVADAAGGVLGFGPRISRAEKKILKRIEAAL